MLESDLSKETILSRKSKLTLEKNRLEIQLKISNSVIKTELIKKALDKVLFDLEYYNKLLSRYW